MINTGKTSEAIFEAYINRLGKDAFLYRFKDAAHNRGLNKGKMVVTDPQPSDYLVVQKGDTFFAEVKSCSNRTSFPLKQIEPAQWAAATRVIAANGMYCFFLHCLPTNTWYEVPFPIIEFYRDGGRESIRWEAISHLEVRL